MTAIDIVRPLVPIANAAVIGWLALVGTLWVAYRLFVDSCDDNTVATARRYWVSVTDAVLRYLGGLTAIGYGVRTVPADPVNEAAFVLTLAAVGTLLASANVVALAALDRFEDAGLESIRNAVGEIALSGGGLYGGGALLALVARTSLLGAVGVTAVGIVGYYACKPLVIDRFRDTVRPPAELEDRWRRLATAADVEDVQFRLLVDAGSTNAAGSGLVPGRRSVHVTAPTRRELTTAELDAIVAHELAHLRGHHLSYQAVGYVGIVVGTMLALTSTSSLALVALSAGMLAFDRYLRALEFDADAFAAELTSPTAIESAVARLIVLETRPRTSVRPFEFGPDYPTMRRRLDRLDAG